MKGITILGSTGTIGVNTLDVIAQHRDAFRVVALTANSNVDALFQQCQQWQPDYAVMVDDACAEQLVLKVRAAGLATTVLGGAAELKTVVQLPTVAGVMAGIVGAAGLLPTLAAARAGKRVMLANKEALVMSGQLFMDAVRDHACELLPIDSEHNAIFQCLPPSFAHGLAQVGVRKILLTASGGPFRTTPRERLPLMTPQQAVKHPNWVMGQKISVDSATMMNKGLEIIEACWLFHTTQQHIEVVVHPQSVVHSMVEYVDGSVIAQLGNPDMRTPIAYALGWPARFTSGVEPLNIFDVKHLDFEPPDLDRFPCLRIAREAMHHGGTATAVLNAANEEAVAAFLREQIAFTQIPELVENALETISLRSADTLENILADDAAARACVASRIQRVAC